MLTDVQIRKAKPAEKSYRLTDSGGLHLYVTPAGGKLWRMRYEFAGKEKLLSFGPYPAISLSDAREARDQAKAELRAGRDPGVTKRRRKVARARAAATTFEGVAREWHALQRQTWTERHASDVLLSLERDVFPTIGATPIRDIEAPEVLALLRDIEGRQARETARRVRQRMSSIFVYAIASGRATADPAAIVQGAMAPQIKGRQPAVTDLDEARKVLRDAEAIPAHPVTRLALRFIALTVVRPGELRGARWDELEDVRGDAPLWIIPAARMKMKREHLVPLSRQAVETLLALHQISGGGPILFPMTRHAHKPLSENALGYLLNRAGYHGRHVPHGWRSTFSTVMNERHAEDARIIDVALAHVHKNKVEGAYNRALYLAQRRKLLQEWADLLMVDQQPADALLGGLKR